ncbi:MAG: ATP-binding protein [Tahibacter sp.]
MNSLRIRPSIRRQLLWLFGLMLVTGGTVLVLDEFNQRASVETLSTLREDALASLRDVKAISDAYGLDLVDTTFRVRNSLMGWEQGVEVLDRATSSIQQHWEQLLTKQMTAEQRSLVAEVTRLRETADRAAAKLRAILKSRDVAALGVFADTELYPAVDPVTTRLGFLSDLKMIAAQQRLIDDARRMNVVSVWRIGLSMFTFLIVILVGRQILRHIYRGVEQLVDLADATRRGEYDGGIGERPRGELGDVADALLGMRAALKRNEVELRESEAHAQEANQAKSAFLAAMSHEIRTPMIGVTGMLELLAHTELDAEQQHCVDVIESSAQTLLRIIGDILDFSKIEAGKLRLAPEPVDLRQLVQGTIDNFLGVASGKGLSLELAIDERVAPAHLADPMRLRQILSNFVANALKFTHKGGVQVEVEQLMRDETTETIALRVHDTGIGIGHDQQDRLFTPFAQAEGGTARQYGGTGLGLAICRRLAQLMGGELGLRSQLGEGTTVSLVVQLPLARREAVRDERIGGPAELPSRAVPDRLTAERERSLVLLVDDHPTNRDVVTRQLARAGYACETANDGVDALALWQSGRYALVLADIHMPRMDGYALVAAIRDGEQREARPRTPVIALTANVTKGEAERCLAAGMDDFLGKPVSIAQLATKLRQWLPHVVIGAGAARRAAPRADSSSNSASTDRATILDRSVLAEIAGDDNEVAAQLLRDFAETVRHDLGELREALQRGDVDEARREAHRIRGASRLVGAGELADAAQACESTLRGAGADPSTIQRLRELEVAFTRLPLA